MVKKNLGVAVIAIGFVNREMPNTKTQSQSYGTLLWFVQRHLLYPDQNKFFIQGSVKRANVNDQLQGLCCHKHHCNNSNDLHNIITITILLTGQKITRYSLAGRWLRSWGSQLVNLGGRTTALLGRLKTSMNIFIISIMIVQKGIISFNIVLQFSYAGIILSVCGCPDLPIGDVAYDWVAPSHHHPTHSPSPAINDRIQLHFQPASAWKTDLRPQCHIYNLVSWS